MINIDALPKPDVLRILDYEEILEQNIQNLKTLMPDWIPLESDEHKMMLEAFAYRELHLRAEFNNLSRAFFLSTSTGNDLDNYAVFYGVTRLNGSKPYATYEFSLSEPLARDVVVPAGLILVDESVKHKARLLDDVAIRALDESGVGVVELLQEIESSVIKTQIITTPLPFVLEAKALGDFANGSTLESDEELRYRILLSMADKSTAGSEETYESFALSADERIEDIAVANGGAGIVNVFYYSSAADELMKTRIEESLNKKEVRPLTDFVVVSSATLVNYSVVAQLKILPNQETAKVYTKAVEALSAGLEKLKKIGVDITLSEINDFLRVDGVKEVVITSPAANVEIADSEIGVCSEKTITYTVI